MTTAAQKNKNLFDLAVAAGFWIHKDHGKWYVGKGAWPLKQHGPFNKAQAKQKVCELFTEELGKWSNSK